MPGRLAISASGDSTRAGLQSNSIVEIRIQGDQNVWLGTGRGLSVMHDSTHVRTFYSSSSLIPGQTSPLLPYGGISAIGVSGDTLLVAVAADTVIGGERFNKGNGLALTSNPEDTTGVDWLYYIQPTDSSGDTLLQWGSHSLRALPITTPINNVTYDIAVSADYFWIGSWAGGLRRLARGQSNAAWERVPLPLDDDDDFLCDDSDYDYDSFTLDPNDPPRGNHNHKVFSVLAYGHTIWVGTANGINRGIVDSDGCIDWKHYSFPLSGISGNWVVGLAKQEWGGHRKVWAVTLRADQSGETNGISYTTDDGETWKSVAALREERGYNIFAIDNLVYVATERGLWKTEDGINFALFRPAVDAENNDQILDNHVYAVLHDTREYYGGPDPGVLWIGTGDGLAKTPDPGFDESIWHIYRTNIDARKVYAYPNPFSPFVDNQLDGDGYVRFHYRVRRSNLIKVNIYNFAMERVSAFDYWRGKGEGALKWDGRDSNGNHVANGVYFCNLFYDNADHWIKLIVLK